MNDRLESEESTTATREDLRQAKEDGGDALGDGKDDVRRSADHAADKVGEAGRKASDAIEDMIPGDSDGDGH